MKLGQLAQNFPLLHLSNATAGRKAKTAAAATKTGTRGPRIVAPKVKAAATRAMSTMMLKEGAMRVERADVTMGMIVRRIPRIAMRGDGGKKGIGEGIVGEVSSDILALADGCTDRRSRLRWSMMRPSLDDLPSRALHKVTTADVLHA